MKTLIIIALVVVLVGIASGQIALTPSVVQVAVWVSSGVKTATAGIAAWGRS
jgi:hypothetical protein